MKTFREHLKEDVIPSALVADGSIDIKKDAVRENINGILAGITSCPSVTPYTSMIKIRKALSYFGIQLPKRTYMEGKHGVEVWEIHQFGNVMGMTDQGEFIKTVPCEYYLFFHYHLFGSMFSVRAKIVDKMELDKELDFAEDMIKENAELRQHVAKVRAPHEPMKDEYDNGTEGTKKAVDITMRRKDKKLSADKLDEVSMGKLVSYKNKAGEGREKGVALADKKMKGKAKVNASAPKHPYMEETLEELKKETLKSYISAAKADRKASKAVVKKGLDTDGKFKHASKKRKQGIERAEDRLEETRMPASIIRHKQKLANMTPEEKAKKFAGKSEEQLKSMARRHGYGKDSDVYSKHVSKKLDEKLTKGMKVSDVISDFVHSTDPKFEGKSKKERMKMALGAYYGMHPEKSKKNLEEKAVAYAASPMKAFRKKAKTVVSKALGNEKDTRTILVTDKDDPAALRGGGVHRIPKNKYDPRKHRLASE